MNRLALYISMFWLALSPAQAQEQHAHDQGTPHQAEAHQGHGDHEEDAKVVLSPAQIKQAGIRTTVVQYQSMPRVLTAPGTIFPNAYRAADITSLIDAVVDARLVRLGDKVKRGQKLVTLSSSALAQAQADYLRAEGQYQTAKQDLARLKALVAEHIVSQARYQQAQSALQAAQANFAAAKAALSAYGMRSRDIRQLSAGGEQAYGKLVLRAPTAGTVAFDDFRLGQHIAAGTRLMQIVDESTVWVEVQLPEAQAAAVAIGDEGEVLLKGGQSAYPAKVVNIHHQLDTVTRTVGVRLQAQNPDDVLHPGMFVRARIVLSSAKAREQALLLPKQAVQRQGGEWIVFVEEEPGHFERREVEVGQARLGVVPIVQGLKAGETVVTHGAFVLASELAKSGFAVHNH